jgi:hypothetical protein
MAFPSLAALQTQIAGDVAQARGILSIFDSCADGGFVP